MLEDKGQKTLHAQEQASGNGRDGERSFAQESLRLHFFATRYGPALHWLMCWAGMCLGAAIDSNPRFVLWPGVLCGVTRSLSEIALSMVVSGATLGMVLGDCVAAGMLCQLRKAAGTSTSVPGYFRSLQPLRLLAMVLGMAMAECIWSRALLAGPAFLNAGFAHLVVMGLGMAAGGGIAILAARLVRRQAVVMWATGSLAGAVGSDGTG